MLQHRVSHITLLMIDYLTQVKMYVTRYINLRGGFKIVLWVKRGVVMDQGVDQPNNGLPLQCR
eukprot:scaffold34835_cov17-Cyclotella_meneghiniana.AAC.1